MSAIGGYFELELDRSGEYHTDAIRVNSGRNALLYLLKARKYKRVFLPYFFCDVLLQPLSKLDVEVCFYPIDHHLEPIFDYSGVNGEDGFIYINYFGVKGSFIDVLIKKCPNCIIDNSQAFYSKLKGNVDSFYSPRKFFGVPDGGYLYCEKQLDEKLVADKSIKRFEHLLKRIEVSAEEGYEDYQRNELSLNELPLMQMSRLTKALLSSIDYSFVSNKRVSNFNYLHQKLNDRNILKLPLGNEDVPLVYPFQSNIANLRETLTGKSIYTAVYWNNVLEKVENESIEFDMVKYTVYLPVDQRYSISDMDRIIEAINGK